VGLTSALKMVVFVDLDESDEPPEHWSLRGHHHGILGGLPGLSRKQALQDVRRVNPNKNSITEALGCYPYVYSLATSVRIH